jgi:hypothetical protein
MPTKLTAYEALAAIDNRKAADARLAEMRAKGVDQRVWDTYQPKEKMALMAAGVRPFKPTLETLTAEWAAQGKAVYTPEDAMALRKRDGKAQHPITAELWGKGVPEAVEAEMAEAEKDGRIIGPPLADYGAGVPLTGPNSPAHAMFNPTPEAMTGLRVKVTDILIRRENLAHANRFLEATKSGEPIIPARLAGLASSPKAEDRLQFVVAMQKLGKLSAEAPELRSTLEKMALGDSNPAVHSRAYKAFGEITGALPAEPAPGQNGA